MTPAADGDQPMIRQANKRGAARLAAVQALYQMDMTAIDLNDVVKEFETHRFGQVVDGLRGHGLDLAYGVGSILYIGVEAVFTAAGAGDADALAIVERAERWAGHGIVRIPVAAATSTWSAPRR